VVIDHEPEHVHVRSVRMKSLLLALAVLVPVVGEARVRSVAVRELAAGEGVTEKTASTLTEAVAGELRRVPSLSVSTQQEIVATLSLETQKQVLACDEAQCMADFGGALGVDSIVTGNLGRLGESWLVNLKLIDVSTVKVAAQADRRIRGGTLDDVLDLLPGMIAELFPPVVAAPSPPVPAAPVAPPSLAERLPGTGRLVNSQNKLCLDPAGFTGARGTKVMLFTCDGGRDQLWRVNADRLENAMGLAVLDVAGKVAKPRSAVQLGRVDTSQDQRWSYVEVGNGWIELRDASTGLCLDVAGYEGKSRDNVMLFSCEQKPDQAWFWERLE